MLTSRQSALATALLKQRGVKTIKSYARELNISERTIYADLKIVEKYLDQMGYEVSKKSGIGIQVVQTANQKHQPAPYKKEEVVSDTGKRRFKIFGILLFQKETITYENLSETFLVSKSSIKNDLDYIRKQYLLTSVKVRSDASGTRLIGSEEQLQKTYVLYNEEYMKRNYQVVQDDEEERLSFLSKVYGMDLVACCNEVLYKLIMDNVAVIADYYIYRVLNMMIVLVYRVKQGYHLDTWAKEGQRQKEKSQKIDELSSEILDQLASKLAITFHEEDGIFLMKHLRANRMQKTEEYVDYSSVLQEVIDRISEALALDLSNDQMLREELAQHFPPMMCRLKENIAVPNPFLTQIKTEFRLMYQVTWLVMSGLEDLLQVKFTEDEIGFLMIYFQLALDRCQVSRHILVVCPMGISTSTLLMNRVSKIVPPFDVITQIPVRDIPKIDIHGIDLIISTVPIELPEKQVVVVSPLLNEEDMKNIAEVYQTTFILEKKKQRKEGIVIQYLKDYISADLIKLNGQCETREEVLTYMTKQLVRKQYAAEEFTNSVLEREKLGHTDLPSGVAIPHGNPCYAKKTVIYIFVNKHPLKWVDHQVRVIILLCIAKQDMGEVKHMLKDIYSLVSNKEMVEEVFMNTSVEKLRNLLGGM